MRIFVFLSRERSESIGKRSNIWLMEIGNTLANFRESRIQYHQISSISHHNRRVVCKTDAIQ